jgi:phosphoribosyl-AMP cyclohydrolase
MVVRHRGAWTDAAARHAWFFSRSGKRLWEKGETSPSSIQGVRVDCDADALIYLCGRTVNLSHRRASCFQR